MELLKSPFLNDPSSLVAQAFAEIYPGTEYEAILVDKITTEDGTEMVGCTTFPDDGTLPLIEVAGHIPAEAVPEILAHELAHIVTVGDEHGPEWKKAFEAIYSKYNELAIARFGAQEPEENQKGGDKWRNQRKRSKSPRQRRRPTVRRYRSTTWTTQPALSRKRSQTAGRFFAHMTKLCR